MAMKRKMLDTSGVPTHISQEGIGGGLSENQIVVYQPNETVRLDVRLENETVWLTQLKIADLFGVQKAAISKHIKNIFESGELIKEATVSKKETVLAAAFSPS